MKIVVDRGMFELVLEVNNVEEAKEIVREMNENGLDSFVITIEE